MRPVHIALIGAGNIAQNVHLPILAKLPGVTLAAICDRNKSTAKILGERYRIPHVCRTVEETLNIDGIDAVNICTSTDAHYETALACLEAGKDALIEKPIARTAAEAQQIHETAERHGRKLMIAMNHRFRPDAMILKNYLEKGELGTISYLKSGWLAQRSNQKRWLAQADKAGGGVMLDLGIVLLDLMLWLSGFREIHSVRAVTHHNSTKKVEDFIIGFLNFKDNTVATLETSWTLQRPEEFFYLNIFAKSGSAYINPLKILRRDGDGFQDLPGLKISSKASLYKKSYQTELQYFVNAVRDLVPVVSTGAEAVERMRIIEALYLSARERCEIALPT